MERKSLKHAAAMAAIMRADFSDVEARIISSVTRDSDPDFAASLYERATTPTPVIMVDDDNQTVIDALRERGYTATGRSELEARASSPRLAGRATARATLALAAMAAALGVPIPNLAHAANGKVEPISEERYAAAVQALRKAQEKRDRKAAKRRKDQK